MPFYIKNPYYIAHYFMIFNNAANNHIEDRGKDGYGGE